MAVATPIILIDGREASLDFELVMLDVLHEFNRVPRAELQIRDGDFAAREFEVSDRGQLYPGKGVEIRLRLEGDPASEATVFKGVVTRHGLRADANGGVLTVELRDPVFELTQVRRNRVFTDKSDSQLMAWVLKEVGIGNDISPTSTKHQQMAQCEATDWDFLLLRAEANGFYVAVVDGTFHAKPADTHQAPGLGLDVGIDEVFSFEIEYDAGAKFDGTSASYWRSDQQKVKRVRVGKGAKKFNGRIDLPAVFAREEELGSMVSLENAEAKAWAEGRQARHRLAEVRGRITVPGEVAAAGLRPGCRLKLTGVGRLFEGEAIITGVRHRLGAQGWLVDLQLGLPLGRLADEPDVSGPVAAGLLPGIHGLQIGKVVKTDGDPDKNYRIQVRVPALAEQALWARLGQFWASRGHGAWFLPEIGDEVVIGFLNDDPRDPIVLGSLYSSKNRPPFTKSSEDCVGIQTAGKHEILINDADQKIELSTPHGQRVVLDNKSAAISIEDQKHGNQLTLDSNGIKLKAKKDLVLEADGNIRLTANQEIKNKSRNFTT